MGGQGACSVTRGLGSWTEYARRCWQGHNMAPQHPRCRGGHLIPSTFCYTFCLLRTSPARHAIREKCQKKRPSTCLGPPQLPFSFPNGDEQEDTQPALPFHLLRTINVKGECSPAPHSPMDPPGSLRPR